MTNTKDEKAADTANQGEGELSRPPTPAPIRPPEPAELASAAPEQTELGSPTPAPADPTALDSAPPTVVVSRDADEPIGDTTRPGTRGRVVAAPREPPGTDASFQLGQLPATDTEDGSHRTAPRQSGFFGLVPWLLLVGTLLALGLVVVRFYMPAADALEQRNGELEAARKDAARLQRQVEALEGSQQELADKVAQRESEVQALQATQEELAARLQNEIEKGNVAISQARGEVVVDLIDKILFDSGEAELNESGAEVLRQVGETLSKVPDKVIQVTGHTDSLPISDKLKETFPSNWELSTHRATNVVRFLQDEVKVPGERLAAVGRSQFDPIASNKNSKGRRRNRRIEVTLIPLRNVER